MNLKPEEQILIKDIFAVSINKNENSLLYLPEFVRDVSAFGNNFSLVDHSTYFDSLLMERLQVPFSQTDILGYLEDSWNRAEDARSKPWNMGQQQQAFIDYSVEIIKNFINLGLHEPEIFPEQAEIEPGLSSAPTKVNEVSRKLMTHFEKRGLNKQLLSIVISGNEKEFTEQILQVLVARQRFTTIIDSKAMFYLTTLIELIRDPNFKMSFLRMKNTIFLPQNEKGGSVFDVFTSFGLFMRLSILGHRVSGHIYQEALCNERFEERMNDQLGNDRLSREKIRMYLGLQTEISGKLLEAYKELMRKDSQKLFLEWNYRLLISNLGRMKLGHRMYNAQNTDLSHDGLLVNAYTCILGLCRVITNRQDDKWRSIDPTYFMYHEKASHFSVDPICSRATVKVTEKREFGTITEFFFLALQFLQVGVCGAMENFSMYNEMKKNMEKNLSNVIGKFPEGHPIRKKAQMEINKIQSKIVRYWILLNDDALITQTVKLLSLLLEMLPKWMGIDYGMLRKARLESKGSEMVCYLPELLLTLVAKYHVTMFSIKQFYLTTVGEEHIRQLLQLTCLLLSDQQIITNPYIAAGYVQLIFSFLHDSKAAIVHEQLKASSVVVNNFTFGLIRFYCGIANTGRSNQFYQKFKYRLYANKIFTTLWSYEVFRQDLKLYFGDPLFEKFINMILIDTNYSFDETNENYEKYRKLLDKKTEGPLSQEDLQNQEMVERIMGANLEQCKSNLKLMRQLSVWSPQTFLTEADRKTAVPLLNNALRTFVDAASFTSNRELLAKFKFESGRALSDLVQIYSNLDISQILSNQIVKDGRNYKKEYFSKALQRASNEHYTTINILQKFQDLINKLSTAENEEENEEIYGEIPEKYLCQLMSTLMCDPVRLPGSQYVVDRVNIKRHLLNDQRDPFTRKPLKDADLMSDKQLKDQIEKWKKLRLQELKKGGKEVKYGNIAANQKETEQKPFENNPVIEEQ